MQNTISRHLMPWLVAALIALVLSAAINLDGPSDARAEWDQSAALQDAIKNEATQARYQRATAALCGSENAIAKDLGNGVIQCQTRRGAKTKQVAM
jgi:hypothetical protein